jgi:hypothetical protein
LFVRAAGKTHGVSNEDILRRLRTDFGFYAPICLKIVSNAGRLVPFEPNPAQMLLEEAVQRQQAEGRPVRLIVPKARKEGVSTYSIGKLMQRATLTAYHNAMSVSHDSKTGAELLDMARTMHLHLPDSEEFPVKPPIANQRRQKEMVFGPRARNTGNTFNSRLTVDTAGEVEGGRGFTLHSFHGSEVAFWADIQRKLTSMLNAVPDDPETMVLLESTSNGHNHWRKLCLQAQAGENDFEIVFLPWMADPRYSRKFISDTEREEFRERVGTGPWGAEEQDLLDIHGCTLEQLNWRRWAIANRCQGDLRIFHQEYPATLEQSFGATGATVFNPDHILLTRQAVEKEPQPEVGTLVATSHKQGQSTFGPVQIPQAPEWKPSAKGEWRVWEQPVKEEQYVVVLDPAGDEVLDGESSAMHAAQVLHHKTGRQVAEMEMQGDPDLVAEQVFLAANWFNMAWVVVEVTGGYGLSINRRIRKDWRYPWLYKRRTQDSSQTNPEQDRYGWDTNRSTRQLIIDGATELLREQTHGIRSPQLVGQMSTFVYDSRRKPVPAPDERSDLLMAWMIGQHARQELTVRMASSGRTVNTSTHRVRYKRTGW